jgi:hypothetical protein
MSLIRLAYISSAVRPLSEAELAELLARARSFNAAHGLTGMLLHAEGNFLQVLEGDEREVDELYERIARDPRHTHLLRLERVPVDRREFADWDMGFRNLCGEECDALPDWLAGIPGSAPPPPREGMALLHRYGGQEG